MVRVGQASKLNNQRNRDLGLNRENTKLWTRMVDCHFWIRVLSG
ncbi:hypothetical protein F383_19496 [Gossypium arboreum]|uniref:Uncharacterized protein n=1 Tax=Gossypium arboreum TaxID=29729 RepID=A0A0B0NPA6_GOSAR|nr:hypothetical protein F383_19496 [Gossypium arboreum]